MKNLKHIYLLIILPFLLSTSMTASSQGNLESFLLQKELPACFKYLDKINVSELLEFGKTAHNGFSITLDYDPRRDVYQLSTDQNCHDTEFLQIKLIEKPSVSYVFLFRNKMELSESYGNIQLYEKEETDSLWNEGRQIEISWENIFDIEKERLEELKYQDQYPKCMITFQRSGMRIEIPWDLYSYDEANETPGYATEGGKQPILLSYDYFLK